MNGVQIRNADKEAEVTISYVYNTYGGSSTYSTTINVQDLINNPNVTLTAR
jgi:hypothetical protein